jgi:hypothetical protein
LGAAQNLAGHLPKPLRQLVRGRSFGSSMSRFAAQVFLQRVDDDEGVVGEEGVLAAGQGEVVAEVVGGLVQVHAVRWTRMDDALVDGGVMWNST